MNNSKTMGKNTLSMQYSYVTFGGHLNFVDCMIRIYAVDIYIRRFPMPNTEKYIIQAQIQAYDQSLNYYARLFYLGKYVFEMFFLNI